MEYEKTPNDADFVSRLESLIAECDDALARGDAAAIEQIINGNPEYASRLQEELSFLLKLQFMRSGPPAELTSTPEDPASPRNGSPLDDSTTNLSADDVNASEDLQPTLGDGGPGLTHVAKQGGEIPSESESKFLEEAIRSFSDPTAEPPKQFGHFQIIREIGRGGSGIVFLAHDLRLDRQVALKLPRAETLASDEYSERYRREAQLSAGLNHPNIVTIFDAGEIGPLLYIASAYCSGISLAEWIEKQAGPAPHVAAAKLVRRLAVGIQHAHSRGILHRDIKPSNVMLEPANTAASNVEEPSSDDCADTPRSNPDFDREPQPLDQYVPQIADFGLAKMLNDDSDLSRDCTFMGTLPYISPEQLVSPKDTTTGTDIYSLGVVLYELLTGTAPFSEGTEYQTLQEIQSSYPPPPREVQPKISRDLETICLKCLRKEPHRRYATAAALAEDLERYLNGIPILARNANSFELARAWVKRHPAWSSAIAMFLIGFALVTWQWWRAELAVDANVKATQEANRQRVEAEQAGKRESVERQRAEKRLYFQRFVRARSEWLSGNLVEANSLLDRCAVEDRDWEWHYLCRLFRPERRYFKSDCAPRMADLSPDKSLLAAGMYDISKSGGVIVWSVETGKKVFERRYQRGGAMSVRFLPDGQRLVVGNAHRGSGSITIWHVPTGELLFDSKDEPMVAPNVVPVSPCGRWIANASKGVVYLRDSETGHVVRKLPGHVSYARCLEFSQDGKRVATINRVDGRPIKYDLRISDVKTGRILNNIVGIGDAKQFEFHPNGKQICVSGYSALESPQGFVQVWDLEPKPRLRLDLPVSKGPVGDATYRADGQLAFSVESGAADVHIVDPNSGVETKRLRTHGRDLCFSRDGQTLVSVSRDSTVKIWDLTRRSNVDLARRNDWSWVRDFSYSPDGKLLAMIGGWSLNQPAAYQRFTVQLWDISNLEFPVLLRDLGGKNRALTSVAFSPCAKYVAAGSIDHHVRVWEAETGKQILDHQEHRGHATSVAFDPSGRFVVSCSKDGTAVVWSLEESKCVAKLLGHKEAVNQLAMHPSGELLITVSDDRTARLWSLPNAKLLQTLPPRTSALHCVAISLDGKRFAIGGDNGLLELHELVVKHGSGSSRTFLAANEKTMIGHEKKVSGLAFHPNGRRVASTGITDRVKIWDVPSGEEAFTMPYHVGQSFAINFSPDGRCLVASSHSGVKIWQTKIETEAAAKDRATKDESSLIAWHIREYATCKRHQNWHGVAFHASAILNKQPGNLSYIANRAIAQAKCENWSAARADFTKYRELKPTDEKHLMSLGLTCLLEGDVEAFKAICKEAYKILQPKKQSRATRELLEMCALIPDATSADELEGLAKSVPGKPSWTKTATRLRGIAAYRKGKFESAATQLALVILPHRMKVRSLFQQAPTKPQAKVPDLAGQLFFAMAQHQVGNREHAKTLLRETTDSLREYSDPRSDVHLNWITKAYCEILLQEANSLILVNDRQSDSSNE